MPALRAHHIQKHYRKNHVLKEVNFTVEPGTLVGIVGENGSGKSTLLKILAGEQVADSGAVSVRGPVGYCPQSPVLNPSLTISEHLAYFQAAYRMTDMDYPQHLLETLRFERFRDERVERLSGGTQQKLNLMLALMHRPAVLLLDEPYQGFDWETYLRFWHVVEELKQSGRAVLVISHLIFERKKFDRILHLQGGYITEEA